MKKLLYLFCGLSLVATLPAIAVSQQEERPIIVRGGTPTPGGNPGPRSTTIPIVCILEDETFNLFVTFTENLGMVSITEENLSTGMTTSVNVDSSEGSFVIPVFGDPGYYAITFVTESGSVYTGDFIL